jgi:hypothetical protein
MASSTEEYKLTILWNKKRYTVVAHSIEMDETIFVRTRKKQTESVYSGQLIHLENNILGIDKQSVITKRNQLHYHPSGFVRIKHNSNTVKEDMFPPLITLKEPIALLKYSPPNIEWLDEANENKHEVTINISKNIPSFKRLDFQIWVGPKDSFKNGFRPFMTYCSLIFNEAFYDVAYFIREMDQLEPELQYTSITRFPENSITPILDKESKSPQIWVGCLAIGRQVRTFMEEFNKLNSQDKIKDIAISYPILFKTSYHLRLSICADGIIGAIGPNLLSSDHASVEWNSFGLSIQSVLQMLTKRTPEFIDAFDLDSDIPKNRIFFRKSHSDTDKMRHEIVVVGEINNLNNGVKYYKLPHEFIRKVKILRSKWLNEIRNS